eukprot:CAMPEP_0172574204 /NCGR_PEP_ID=MMETSP1067-20121228/136583_1 /TAXON_ID=265564 ORGANISM="Thalassiosira punctigera, Strain Tpunct2005C2" /NCGR_SAMPLE_ID=MMETSP1067 /ASSEMBLY_ACC=CAM_ASM_000444 /LENGTH=291 /DNA_ID=CAMNT_0013366827 /DNA_START=124 /DNA_END=999 /DNA_ORIENTATION=-
MKSPALGLLLLLALIRVPHGGVRASEARVRGAAMAEISEELPTFEIVAEEGEAAPRRLRKGRNKCTEVNANNTKLVEWCYKQCEGCKCERCNLRKQKKAQNSKWCRALDCSSFATPDPKEGCSLRKQKKAQNSKWCRALDCSSFATPDPKDGPVEVRDHALKMCNINLGMSKKKERWCRDRCDFCRGTRKCDTVRNPDKTTGCVNGVRENTDLKRCQALECRDPDDHPSSSSSSNNLNSRMGVWRANPFDGGDGDDPDDDDDTSELDAEFLATMAEYDPYIGLAGEARGSL